MTRDAKLQHAKSVRWKPGRRCQLADESEASFTPSCHTLHWIATHLLRSKWFNMIMNTAVFLNAVSIGIDQSARLAGGKIVALDILENVFMCLFIIELLMKVVANGVRTLSQGWMLMDSFVVGAAVFENWVAPLLVLIVGEMHSLSFLVVGTVVRIARLGRLVRTIRFLRMFPQLRMLVHAFMGSVKVVVYVLIVLLLVLFTFSAAGLELITLRYRESRVPPEITSLVETWFPNFGMTMLTLMQVTTLDSIGSIYRPLIDYDWTLVFYFVPCVLIISVVLMNIITAVIVNVALEQSSSDKELRRLLEDERKGELMDQLYMMFQSLDADGSGTVLLDELLAIKPKDLELLHEFCGDMDIKEVFNTLDVDGLGSLDIVEFCEGLYRAVMDGTPLELRRVAYQLNRLEKVVVQMYNICTNSSEGHTRESVGGFFAPRETEQPPIDETPRNSEAPREDGRSSTVTEIGGLGSGCRTSVEAPNKRQSGLMQVRRSVATLEDAQVDPTSLRDIHRELTACITDGKAGELSGVLRDGNNSVTAAKSRQTPVQLLRRSQAALEEMHWHWLRALSYNLDAQRGASGLDEEGRQSRWCANLNKGMNAVARKTDPHIMEVVAAAREEIAREWERGEGQSNQKADMDEGCKAGLVLGQGATSNGTKHLSGDAHPQKTDKAEVHH